MAVAPLNPHVRIVDEQGRPTPEFIRWWQTQLQTNDIIVPLGTAAEVSAVVDLLADSHGDILFRGDTLWEGLPAGAAGYALATQGPGADPVWVTLDKAFTDLTDAPSAYTGAAGQAVLVNGAEDGLEFATIAQSFLNLTDTPDTYTGQAGLVVSVRADETGLQFSVGSGGGGGGFKDKATFTPITDATSWVSVGVVDPRATGAVTMRESDFYGYVGWDDTGGSIGQTRMLESATRNPTAGANFDFVFRIDIYQALDSPTFNGIFVRNSATGRFVTFGLFNTNNRWYRQFWNGGTLVSETDISRLHSGIMDWTGYLRAVRTGDNLIFHTSVNGINWIPHNAISIAAHVVDIDKVGIFTNPDSAAYNSIMLWGMDTTGPQTPPLPDPVATNLLLLEGDVDGYLLFEGDIVGRLILEEV